MFEQSGRVMNNTVNKNDVLETTNTYKTAALTGLETYIWELSSSKGYFKIKNVSVGSYGYIRNYNSTEMSFNNSTNASLWYFEKITDEDKFYIRNNSNGNRYLGYNSTYKGYKAYLDSSSPSTFTVYRLEAVTSEEVNITTAGLATYVSEYPVDYSEVAGLKAYKAHVSGNTVALTGVGEVPPGEGVLLRATTALDKTTAFIIPTVASVAAWDESDNDFIRGTGAAVASSDDGYDNYILNQVDGIVGFYHANSQTVATNRAYLKTTAENEARPMTLVFNDEATAIREIKNRARNLETVYYDLQGRWVAKPERGLYIVNGRKIVIP